MRFKSAQMLLAARQLSIRRIFKLSCPYTHEGDVSAYEACCVTLSAYRSSSSFGVLYISYLQAVLHRYIIISYKIHTIPKLILYSYLHLSYPFLRFVCSVIFTPIERSYSFLSEPRLFRLREKLCPILPNVAKSSFRRLEILPSTCRI